MVGKTHGYNMGKTLIHGGETHGYSMGKTLIHGGENAWIQHVGYVNTWWGKRMDTTCGKRKYGGNVNTWRGKRMDTAWENVTCNQESNAPINSETELESSDFQGAAGNHGVHHTASKQN